MAVAPGLGGDRLQRLELAALCIAAQSCQTVCDPWTVAHQAPLSMGFSRQEYWSGWPRPPWAGWGGCLPNPGIEPGSPALQADSLPSEPPGKPLELEGSVYNSCGVRA